MGTMKKKAPVTNYQITVHGRVPQDCECMFTITKQKGIEELDGVGFPKTNASKFKRIIEIQLLYSIQVVFLISKTVKTIA